MNKSFSLTLFLCALIQFNFGWGQVANQKYRILTSGLQDAGMQTAKDVVSEKWGIELYPAASCVVSRELMDSIRKHNNAVEPLITKQYGEGWAEKFLAEIEEEFRRELEVMAILDETDFIINKKNKLEQIGKKGFLYLMYPVKNSTEYNVSATTWGELDGKSEWVSYYRLMVDSKTKKVKILSDELVSDELHTDY